jgi:hypothetical protein
MQSAPAQGNKQPEAAECVHRGPAARAADSDTGRGRPAQA